MHESELELSQFEGNIPFGADESGIGVAASRTVRSGSIAILPSDAALDAEKDMLNM